MGERPSLETLLSSLKPIPTDALNLHDMMLKRVRRSWANSQHLRSATPGSVPLAAGTFPEDCEHGPTTHLHGTLRQSARVPDHHVL